MNAVVQGWLRAAQSGKVQVYHCGNLARDRLANPALDESAQGWLEAAEAGLVHLSQRRLGDDLYIYRAERTAEISE